MTYEKMKEALKQEAEQRLNYLLQKLETEEGLKQAMRWYGKKYTKNHKEHMQKYLRNKYERDFLKDCADLDKIAQAQPLPCPLIITVEWKKNRTWRSNPRAYTNFGFVGSSIGGCGYDKQSTATAEALNATPAILQRLYDRKEQELQRPKDEYREQNGHIENSQRAINHYCFGYGSGYGIIPTFEGGVGVECHLSILRKLGYDAHHQTNTPNTDVFVISAEVSQ